MILYINGCSYSYKSGTLQPNWSERLRPALRDEIRILNDARNGGGNDRILHTTLNSVQSLMNEGRKPELAIIQWTHPNRRRHQSEDGQIHFVNHFETQFFPKGEPIASEETLHYMYLLHYWLKGNGIPHLFFNYIPLHQNHRASPLLDGFDSDIFIGFDGVIDCRWDSVCELMKSEGLCKDDYGHQNGDGYRWLAEWVLKAVRRVTPHLIK